MGLPRLREAEQGPKSRSRYGQKGFLIAAHRLQKVIGARLPSLPPLLVARLPAQESLGLPEPDAEVVIMILVCFLQARTRSLEAPIF